MINWISVKDRLPSDSQDVLVFSDKARISRFYNGDDGIQFFHDSEISIPFLLNNRSKDFRCTDDYYDPITHWAEINEPEK